MMDYNGYGKDYGKDYGKKSLTSYIVIYFTA